MKIVIVGPAHPYRGGIADTNESFCKSLMDQGHEASLVTFTYQYPGFLFPGKTQYSTEDAPRELHIKRIINTINPFNWLSAARQINKQKPDLVIVRYWLPFLAPSLGSIVRRLHKSIIKIAMCDNVIPHEKRIGDKMFTQYFMNSFDGFITLSNTTYKEINAFSDKPKTFFPHPINTNLGHKTSKQAAYSHLQLDPENKYLLFFGLIRKYKGLDLTLKALADSRLKTQNLHLLIVGEFYEEPEKYLKMIKEYDLEARVTIINEFVPTSDIKYYFSASDLVIQTYHTASQSGISQMAFNFDCPILVTDVGGLSEIVKHNKVGYVTQRDPKDIADHILDFFVKNRFKEFSQNIETEKQKYSWHNFSEELLNLSSTLK